MTPDECVDDPKKVKGMWKDGPPPVAPAVQNTISLSVQFFAIYLALKVLETVQEVLNPPLGMAMADRLEFGKQVLGAAKDTVTFAPMLCILFIGARQRALRLDPKHGAPQKYAQTCMYICAYSVLFQALLVILGPMLGGKLEKGSNVDDPPTVMFENKTIGAAVTVTRYLAIVGLYVSFTCIIYSVFTIEAPDGKPTPPVPPAMQCVIDLTVEFFSVYLFLFIFNTVRDFGVPFPQVLVTLEKMKTIVAFCPMLAVILIGVRMRALELTNNKGAPPGWLQDAMFFSTEAIRMQIVMAALEGIIMPVPPKEGEEPQPLGVVATLFLSFSVIVANLALLALYGGVVFLCV